MPEHWTSDASFVDACVGLNRAVCVAVVDDELAAKRVPFTKGAVFHQGAWLDAGALKWDAIAVTRCQTPIPRYALVSVTGQSYAIGRGCKLILGRGAQWQTRELELPHELCGLAWFRDRLYACSTRELYVWDGARFQVHAFDGDRPRTLQSLSIGEKGLCAVGPKDLFLYDGAAWTRID